MASLPERGSLWRHRHDLGFNAIVMGTMMDLDGQSTMVLYRSNSKPPGEAWMCRTLDSFMDVFEPVPTFEPGDVIEYPSGIQYLVTGNGNTGRRVGATETALTGTHLAWKIN
jgi:hypothetical protein